MSEQERWGIHVDGITLSDFNSSEEAIEYKKKRLQGKDAVVFLYYQKVKKSAQEEQEEDYYTPGHA